MNDAPIWKLLEAQGNLRQLPSGAYIVSCRGPVHKHGDRNPSLAVAETDGGKVLLHCMAGDETEDVLKAFGATWSDLWPGGTPPGEKRFEARDRTGKSHGSHQRYYDSEGKKRGGWAGHNGVGATEMPLYGAEKIKDLLSGGRIFLTEGEPACEALWKHNVAAVGTMTGSGSTPCDKSLLDLRKHTVVLWPDNDDVGRSHMERIAKRLTALGIAYLRLECPNAPPKGDAVDYFAFGGTVEALEEMITEGAGDDGHDGSPESSPEEEQKARKAERAPKQADILVTLAEELGVELFHTPDHSPFALVPVGDHKETWALKSSGFKRYISRAFYQRNGSAPSEQAYQEARAVLEGKAIFDGEEHKVWLRVAEHEGAVYLDLCNDAWSVVKITASGWKIISNPPIRFRRARGMLALPTPVQGGTVDDLWSFVNVSEDHRPLLTAWLMGAYSPSGPYPALLLRGPQGSAKSTLARILRALTDPNEAPVRKPPKDSRDLAVAAHNSWMVLYDNMSAVQRWLSDDLCLLSTGGGLSTTVVVVW